MNDEKESLHKRISTQIKESYQWLFGGEEDLGILIPQGNKVFGVMDMFWDCEGSHMGYTSLQDNLNYVLQFDAFKKERKII